MDECVSEWFIDRGSQWVNESYPASMAKRIERLSGSVTAWLSDSAT